MTNEMFAAFADIFPDKKLPKYYDLFYAPLERYLKGLVVDESFLKNDLPKIIEHIDRELQGPGWSFERLCNETLRKESWLSESECVRNFQKATSSMRQLAVYRGNLGKVKERFLQILKNSGSNLQKL